MAEENVEIIEETVETQEIETDPETGKTYEDLATAIGWRPKEEYTGNPENYTDAKNFYEKGIGTIPILRQNMRVVQDSLESLKKDFSAQKEYYDTRLAADEKRHQAELEKKARQAAEDGDLPAYDAARKEMEATTPAPPKNDFMLDPAVQDFTDRNTWYPTDNTMTLVASAYSKDLTERAPTLSVAQNLERTEAHIRDQFPHKFEEKRKQTVAHGRRVAPKSSANTYASMPEESRVACDRAVKIGLCDRDSFVKNYHEMQS